ncbi:death-associated protein kinase 2 isoform X1 [Alosa sapidissima]|uniref:death-associated protein kinase 2 isoform X1 n=1 Tax=Alosa sapidissima TaxID=34773 RepID=UPI001C080AB5|nr:death-associated protein kinase 2 isoform X1 [Alosa sapidissima]XP_041932763.1 death-associated protein kinase 2 isoform X1 [Alosa sapidissima]
MAVFKLENVEDLYEIGEVLGSGHFGQVREVRERASGARWAGKFLKIRRGAGSRLGMERKSVEREVEVLQALQHYNIMALRDVFESRAEIVLIVELISGGELFDFIAEKESLTETEAIEFLKQILQGVSYMHSKHIGHFDLKPENVMLSSNTLPNPDVKIIDFGMAHRFIQGEEYRSMGGTPQYIAPEVINYEPLGTAADMWSMGVITYILLSGLSPFQGYTDEETLRNVVGMVYEFDDQHFSQTSAMAKDFIQKLLVKDQKERMTAEDCLLHPWIKPLTRTQIAKRNRSSINMKNFKKFNAKRKWKMSYNMVSACNRLCRLQLHCKTSALQEQEMRATVEKWGDYSVERYFRCESAQLDFHLCHSVQLKSCSRDSVRVTKRTPKPNLLHSSVADSAAVPKTTKFLKPPEGGRRDLSLSRTRHPDQ